MSDLYSFSDIIISDYYSGSSFIPLDLSPNSPDWKNITFVYGFYADTNNFVNSNYTQLYAVPVLNQLENYLNDSINGSKLNTLLLSGHGETLGLVLAVFNLTNPTCLWDNFKNFGIVDDPICHFPDFASSIKIELYNDGGSYSIRFYYDDYLVKLPGCPDVQCPYSSFVLLMREAVNQYTMDDFNKLCANSG